MSLPLLQVDQLQVGYAAPVIGPLSFHVNQGEVIGLAGPNGTGKSTLLRAVADSVHVFAGEIRKRAGLTIGWMEQHPAQLPEMPFNGWEYLCFTEVDGTPPEPLASWLDQRVDALSGGQYQLLCLWSVLGGNTDLLLLDEPTNNLDQNSASLVEEVLRADQGERAVLVVSHERDFLERVAHRVLEVTG
jgi:zinc transport system ATP-binding protein